MEGKGPAAWAYWDRLQELVDNCGPHSIVANKTGIAFMVRVRFAGSSSVSEGGMSFHFWLKSRIESPRFSRVEHIAGRDRVYRLRVTSLADLDDEVQEWLGMAYEVGSQRA